MKRLLSLILFLFPLALAAQMGTNYQQLFWQQMKQSCRNGMIWEKTVIDLAEGGKPASKQYRMDCTTGRFAPLNGETKGPNPGEFEFLFEYSAQSPFLKDYFDLKQKGQGLQAKLLEENYDDTPLKEQVFEVDEKGQLRHVRSLIIKDNMLYDLKVDIQVWFDAQGRYERHKTETYTEPVLDDGVHTLIEGKWVSN